LKVLLVNLLAALNFANVFLNKKRLDDKKTLKRKKRDQNKKNVKNVIFIYDFGGYSPAHMPKAVLGWA